MALIEKNGCVLMGLRNYTKDVWKDVSVWTSPGGRSEDSETVEETLRREVQEETGITTLSIENHIASAPGAQGDDIVHFFYCTTTEEPVLMEPEKFSEWKWVPIQDFIDNGMYGGFNSDTRKETVKFLKSIKK